MKTKTELTDEQKAEAIAEWLGLERYPKGKGTYYAPKQPLRHKHIIIAEEWLASDAGTVAMQSKLEKLYIRQEHWAAAPNSIILKLTSDSFDWMEYKRVYVQVREPTLNAALQATILEVMNNG